MTATPSRSAETNPWPTTPAAIRAASRIGARPLSLPRPSRRRSLEPVAHALMDAAILAASLFLIAATTASR